MDSSPSHRQSARQKSSWLFQGQLRDMESPSRFYSSAYHLRVIAQNLKLLIFIIFIKHKQDRNNNLQEQTTESKQGNELALGNCSSVRDNPALLY